MKKEEYNFWLNNKNMKRKLVEHIIDNMSESEKGEIQMYAYNSRNKDLTK